MASHFIASSSSLLSDAWRPLSTQYTHSALFNPVAVLLECLSIPPHECGVCLRVACRQGRRARLRASRGGRLLDAIDIATIEVKMPKEEERRNLGWTSSADFQTDILASYPAVCGST